MQATVMSDAGSYRSDGDDTILRTPVSTRNVVSWNCLL